MNALKNLKLIGILLLLVVGLAACNKPGPAESAGKKIDQTTEKAGKKIDDAAEKAGDKLEEAGEKLKK